MTRSWNWLPLVLALVVGGCESDRPSTPSADAAPGAADATPPGVVDAASPTAPDATSADAQGGCDGPEDCGGAGHVCCMIQTASCTTAEACQGIELCHAPGDCRGGVCCPQGFCGPGCD